MLFGANSAVRCCLCFGVSAKGTLLRLHVMLLGGVCSVRLVSVARTYTAANTCPPGIGELVALTGCHIRGAGDALGTKLATHFVPFDRLETLVESLKNADLGDDSDARTRTCIEAVAETAPESMLLKNGASLLSKLSAAGSVDEAVATLESEAQSGDWASEFLPMVKRGYKMWSLGKEGVAVGVGRSIVDVTTLHLEFQSTHLWWMLLADEEYVSLLRKIYKDQKASVQTDEESESFDIQKGSKQGDPMSSLLFNTVLQYSLKNEIQRWQKKKGMGIYLSDQERDCLTNLRFADDVMLFATSKEQIRNMMYEFKKATEKVGLRIHPDKTNILSNESTINSNTKRHIEVGEMSIEILAKNESVKYLGQRISFHQQETLEITSRIRAAWTTFHKYRQELTSKKYMLKTPSPTLRRHSLSDSLLRSRNMDTKQRTRKNDSIDATQDATPHHPDEKKIQEN